MAVLDTLTASIKTTIVWSGEISITGTDYNSLSNSGSISKTVAVASTTANAVAGGGDQFISYILTIAASGTSTVDLTALTNILQQSATLARIKGVVLRLLSTTDDATNGTNCSNVTIGNAASNAQKLFLDAATDTFTMKNGGCLSYADPSAAGFVVDASNKNLKIVNNDSSNAAAFQLTVFGGGT